MNALLLVSAHHFGPFLSAHGVNRRKYRRLPWYACILQLEGNKRHETQMGLHETDSELCGIASWDCLGWQNFWITTIGVLSSDDDDGNENS